MQTIKINPEAKKSISWILLITLLATVVLGFKAGILGYSISEMKAHKK